MKKICHISLISHYTTLQTTKGLIGLTYLSISFVRLGKFIETAYDNFHNFLNLLSQVLQYKIAYVSLYIKHLSG
jgi:hypothetical protein